MTVSSIIAGAGCFDMKKDGVVLSAYTMSQQMWPGGGAMLAHSDITTNLSQLTGTFNEQLVWRGGRARQQRVKSNKLPLTLTWETPREIEGRSINKVHLKLPAE